MWQNKISLQLPTNKLACLVDRRRRLEFGPVVVVRVWVGLLLGRERLHDRVALGVWLSRGLGDDWSYCVAVCVWLLSCLLLVVLHVCWGWELVVIVRKHLAPVCNGFIGQLPAQFSLLFSPHFHYCALHLLLTRLFYTLYFWANHSSLHLNLSLFWFVRLYDLLLLLRDWLQLIYRKLFLPDHCFVFLNLNIEVLSPFWVRILLVCNCLSLLLADICLFNFIFAFSLILLRLNIVFLNTFRRSAVITKIVLNKLRRLNHSVTLFHILSCYTLSAFIPFFIFVIQALFALIDHWPFHP